MQQFLKNLHIMRIWSSVTVFLTFKSKVLKKCQITLKLDIPAQNVCEVGGPKLGDYFLGQVAITVLVCMFKAPNICITVNHNMAP